MRGWMGIKSIQNFASLGLPEKCHKSEIKQLSFLE
jgi:hypothetical protein